MSREDTRRLDWMALCVEAGTRSAMRMQSGLPTDSENTLVEYIAHHFGVLLLRDKHPAPEALRMAIDKAMKAGAKDLASLYEEARRVNLTEAARLCTKCKTAIIGDFAEWTDGRGHYWHGNCRPIHALQGGERG